MRPIALLALIGGLCAALGCGKGPEASSSPGGSRAYKPINSEAAVFWDRQTTETAELLRQLADDYNAGRPQGLLPIKVEHVGGYSDIFRKVSASIEAGVLPSLAVAYQSMTAEYVQADAVVALDDLVSDPQNGLSQEDLADFFPVVLETNKYPTYGNKMYSFPFCKSVLMLYFNKDVLAKAGFDQPPRTWDEFLGQCRKVTEVTGKAAYAVNVDCSTIAGMIYSMGGEVVSGTQTQFDSPVGLKVFGLLETLAREKLAYTISPGTYDDEMAFSRDEVAFIMRSSSGKTSTAMLMKGRDAAWGMAAIPQADPAAPSTVLYGPNICLFKTTPEQQAAGWDFTKFFTSPDINVRWALGTGYLPIRKSAAEDARVQEFWAQWPYNKAAYDCLAYARSEPNLAGWQEVRSLVEKAEMEVMTGLKTAQQTTAELKAKADEVLSRR